MRIFENPVAIVFARSFPSLVFALTIIAALAGVSPRAAIAQTPAGEHALSAGRAEARDYAPATGQTEAQERTPAAGRVEAQDLTPAANQAEPQSRLAATPTTAEYLAVENGRLFYEVFGEGFPIVFIHDGLAHREVWDDQVLDLYPDYRVIRYDRRGYGKSDEPTAQYSNVADLHSIVEHLKLDRAVFVGSSAGGGLAINYALAHPERVEALVLVGAVVDGYGVSFHLMRRGYENFSLDPEESVNNWINDIYAVAPGNDDARARLAELLRANPQNLSRGKGQLAQDPEKPALASLGKIRVPTLIVTAEHDHPDAHAHAGAIEAGITVSRRIVLDDAGHLVYLERPAAFNDAIR